MIAMTAVPRMLISLALTASTVGRAPEMTPGRHRQPNRCHYGPRDRFLQPDERQQRATPLTVQFLAPLAAADRAT
jgi:hypothetical protein